MSTTTTHHDRTLRPASLRLAAAGALAALALAGCETGVVHEEPTPVADAPTTESAPATQAPAEPAPTTEEPTEEPTQEDPEPTTEEPSGAADEPTDEDTGGAGDAAPGEVPAPGTEFRVGDTVTTHVQALDPGDEYYGYATLATTVTEVEPGDPALFEDASNAADFAGYTPWFVQVEFEWLTYEGAPNSTMTPTVVAFNEAGGEVSPVINSTWSAGIPGCELDLPDEKGVGETGSSCTVFAVPDGESIGAVGWRGDDYADGGGSAMDNPYYDEPVLWVVP